MRIFLTPTDVLFFRGARPFNAGEGGGAQSIFPPTPETFQGMLRALIAAQWAPTLHEAFQKPEVRELVGYNDLKRQRSSYGRFRLTSVTLGYQQRSDPTSVTRLFPAPTHLQRVTAKNRPAEERGEEERRVLLRPRDPREVAGWEDGHDGEDSSDKPTTNLTNLPDGMRLVVAPDEPVEKDETLKPFGHWLSEDELNICLSGSTKGITGTPGGAIYEMEPRIGIGLDAARKTTEDGLLYQTTVVRMKSDENHGLDYGLVVDFELAASAAESAGSPFPPGRIVAAHELRALLNLPETGWYPLGGERHVVRYQVIPGPRDEEPEATHSQPRQRTLLYFATPACFERGWRPASWEARFGAAPATAAIPSSQLIGGWTLEPGSAGGAAKPLRRCVPAGSVYYFDRPLTARGPYSDYGREIGYGYALEGGW